MRDGSDDRDHCAAENATRTAPIIGSATSVDALNRLVPRITKWSYVEKKQKENTDAGRAAHAVQFRAARARKPFDLYARQNFLDNTLRGGLPISLRDDGKATTIHLYSRKHGDLERDYNDYRLSATNYSQGNGNFRDVNQNRRNDLLINPDVRESNVEHFFNLIQLDGFNPLIVKVTSFTVKNRKALDKRAAQGRCRRKSARRPSRASSASGSRRASSCRSCNDRRIKLSMDTDAFIGKVLGACCESTRRPTPGHGYWCDHWIYNLDLLENYLAVYPEKLRYILMDKKSFTFFDNPHRVLPRDDKYVVWDGLPMQLGAVTGDPEKENDDQAAVRGRRTRSGRAPARATIYRTTLINKMVCLVGEQARVARPAGVGIEMESDKPNWYDALNGLPGQLGSSISETLELKRLILFMLESLDEIMDHTAGQLAALRRVRGAGRAPAPPAEGVLREQATRTATSASGTRRARPRKSIATRRTWASAARRETLHLATCASSWGWR